MFSFALNNQVCHRKVILSVILQCIEFYRINIWLSMKINVKSFFEFSEQTYFSMKFSKKEPTNYKEVYLLLKLIFGWCFKIILYMAGVLNLLLYITILLSANQLRTRCPYQKCTRSVNIRDIDWTLVKVASWLFLLTLNVMGWLSHYLKLVNIPF